MQAMEFEVNDEDIKHVYNEDNAVLGDGLEGRARLQFVRKVYTLLSLQLLATVAMTCLSIYNEAFRQYQANNNWLMAIMMVLLVASQIGVLCTRYGRRSPASLYLLFLFTIAESYLVSSICGIVAEQ